jgi:hypothetical protein
MRDGCTTGKEFAILAIGQKMPEIRKFWCVGNDQAGFAHSGLVVAQAGAADNDHFHT